MTWHLFWIWYASHLLLSIPLTLAVYVLIGTLNATVHEAAVRHVNRLDREHASWRRKALAYLFFPLSAMKTEHDRSFLYFDGDDRIDVSQSSDSMWADFRNGY